MEPKRMAKLSADDQARLACLKAEARSRLYEMALILRRNLDLPTDPASMGEPMFRKKEGRREDPTTGREMVFTGDEVECRGNVCLCYGDGMCYMC